MPVGASVTAPGTTVADPLAYALAIPVGATGTGPATMVADPRA